MIANAIGANVLAIDISEEKLRLASALGAVATVNATQVANVAEAVIEITKGGAHVSLDALGHPTTCFNSISNLRKRGKHIQVGAHELEILGSHGMQAHRYDALFAMIEAGKLPEGRVDMALRRRRGDESESSLPISQPARNCGSGGRSFQLPSGAPLSTHAAMASISFCDSRASFVNCAELASACHGGISRFSETTPLRIRVAWLT
jgi:hypothetical protein